MNAPLSDLDLRPRTTRLLAGALSFGLVCAFAHAQDEPKGIARLLEAEAKAQLTDRDPAVRGEAALIVASRSAPDMHAAILAVAHDEDPDAQLRGIVALGLQATPGTAVALDELLGSANAGEPRAVAAAFALGLLPADAAPELLSRVLSSFTHGSPRRQHDRLLALLLGLEQGERAQPVAALRRLYDDDAMRDPILRAHLLRLLLPNDTTLDEKALLRILERGGEEERLQLLLWLGNERARFGGSLVPPVERLATAGARSQDRVAALAALTRIHHLPALEIGARALRATQPAECGQGVRTVLTLGGAAMRVALDQHIRDEADPARKAAMIDAFDAPPSAELVAMCTRSCTDVAQPLPLRAAAARLLARSDPERAQPLLRDLFRTALPREILEPLATDLMRAAEPPALSRLFDEPDELGDHPDHWRALLAADHPGAMRAVMTALADRSAATRANALATWRKVRVLPPLHPSIGAVPPALARILGD